MKKELFKLLVAEFEKLGINPTKWFGTRTNVKRLSKNTLSKTSINEFALKREFDDQGVERIIKLFDEEARYLAQLNDVEANQLLNNLKIANKIVNPPAKPEAGIYTLKEGKKLTPDEYTGKAAADQQKIQSAMLKAGMSISRADQELAKRLKLDMSKASNFDKLQAWKEKHGVPDFTKDEGIGSLFKVLDDNPLADLGSQLDNIEKEGKSLADEAQKLVDLAWKMSPEGQAAEELFRKDILKRSMEGKGFAGGVFGDRNDGFFRALVRPFLLDQHEKGIIKLADNTLDSLKNSNDLKSGGGNDFMYADPVRVFRKHYGDDAFDLIPNEEAFGGGQYGPGRDRINEVLNKVIGKPILKVGPDNPGGYLTKGEYQAKLDHEDEVLRYINEGEGRFGEMSKEEILEEIAGVKQRKDSIMMAFRTDHPTANFQKKDFRSRKEWEDAEIKAQADETLDKKLEGTGVTKEGFVDPGGPEVSGIDDKLKSDFEVISGDSKKGKEIAEKLGITAKPGFPVTEAGKADLKVVKPKKKIDRPSIRLMKNFDQELDDIGLAKEGYNLQEIGILQRARQVMKDEGQNPDDALTWVRSEMADKAGVDIEEFMPDFDWGDFPGKDSFAQGGGVGSLFKPMDRARYSAAGEVAKYAGKKVIVGLEWLLKQLKGKGKWEKEIEKLEKRNPDEMIDMTKLMKGKDKIKLYSGSVERPSNTWESFVEDAKMFDTTPEKIAKDKFKDQWFTPYKSYAEAFTSPHDLKSKMRTVELTPKEIAIANRYKDKVNKLETISMRKKLGLPDPPKHHITTDENTVIIPRYKLRELEEADRIETDYMILEKLKKKVGLTHGGGVGSMFRRV